MRRVAQEAWNPRSAAPSKARQLRDMLLSPELEFLMEAHNGLSAKIVEEAGFKGIWASGLSMSAALGVRGYMKDKINLPSISTVDDAADVTRAGTFL